MQQSYIIDIFLEERVVKDERQGQHNVIMLYGNTHWRFTQSSFRWYSWRYGSTRQERTPVLNLKIREGRKEQNVKIIIIILYYTKP